MRSLPDSSLTYGSSSREMMGRWEEGSWEEAWSKNLSIASTISCLVLERVKGARYWRKFLHTISTDASLLISDVMLEIIAMADSRSSWLGRIGAYGSLPFGLNPEALTDRRSTNIVSGVRII